MFIEENELKEKMKKSKFRGPESNRVRKTIALLEKAARKSKARSWAAVAEFLKKPARRKKRGVNLFKLEKFARDGETIVVPSTVLGEGSLTKKVEVIAFKATKSARQKLGAKLVPLEKAVEKNPDGKKVRIMA